MADQAIAHGAVKYDAASTVRVTSAPLERLIDRVIRRLRFCRHRRRCDRHGNKNSCRDHAHRTGLSRHQAFKLWVLIGNWRMRLPVALAIAFSTAGAATAMVGSPTPPHQPPDGMTMVSTLGISLSFTGG